jgi:hypothetical protein
MVSRKIVFDFLLDDHDSQAAHNYRSDAQNTLLHWDSGLAWRHGLAPLLTITLPSDRLKGQELAVIV